MNRMLNRKGVKLVLVLIPLIIAGVGMYLFSTLPKSDAINLEGSVEISTSTYYAKTSGTVAQVLVQTGQAVKAGDVLAVIDSAHIENQLEQLNAALVMKTAKLNELLENPQTDTIQAARQSAQNSVSVYEERLTAAQRALDSAQSEYETQQALYDAGAIAKAELDQYESVVTERTSAVTISKSELAAAKSNVNTFGSPEVSENTIQAAQADVRLTQLQIEQLETSRGDYTLTAQKDGVVVSKSAEVGSIVVQGQGLFELSNENDRYYVFYLPEEYIQTVKFGDTLALYPFNSDKQMGTATICYIDWKAIYTPKDFESGANKNKKSIKIKALIDCEQTLGVGQTLITKMQRTQTEP